LNLVEFTFALFTVFGTTTFWWCWTNFVYGIEEKKDNTKSEASQKKSSY
tara:strand:+ start:302 stop:448 length:147 start_codon:yes stop_codon:yes gene_type:complete